MTKRRGDTEANRLEISAGKDPDSGSRLTLLAAVLLFELGRRHVTDRVQQPLLLERLRPFRLKVSAP